VLRLNPLLELREASSSNGRVLLLPGLGHVPRLEAPGRVLPPLVEFLKEELEVK
jgi:hypothetical protein